jgi:diphthine-ammonia ligase
MFSRLFCYGKELTKEQFSSYNLETVLALQHLWRIGVEMNVSWWTGAVAYLSHDTTAHIRRKAMLASTAWSSRHRATLPSDADSEDDIDDDDQPRDLWEERYHGGLESRGIGASSTTNILPDWSLVSITPSPHHNTPKPYLPPFFAAEVDSLPRSSSIEWQALLGLTSGRITISSATSSLATLHELAVAGGSTIYSTLMLFHPLRSRNGDVEATATKWKMPDVAVEALRELSSAEMAGTGRDFNGASPEEGYYGAYSAWLDCAVDALWGAEAVGYGGVVPCRSLWDGDGRRLAAVLLFRTDVI